MSFIINCKFSKLKKEDVLVFLFFKFMPALGTPTIKFFIYRCKQNVKYFFILIRLNFFGAFFNVYASFHPNSLLRKGNLIRVV